MRNVLRTLASDQHASGRHQAASVLAQSSLYRVGMSAKTQTVEMVRGMDKKAARYFHLSPCGGCGMPTWQQPCPVCGYYPMGNVSEEQERCRPYQDKGRWLRLVKRHGSIAAWYWAGRKRTVAWSSNWSFREETEALIEQCASMEWPDPEAVYEEVVR